LADEGVYAGDLRTGQGAVLVPGDTGRTHVGMSFDARTGYLFVAGGPTGHGYVYDTASGKSVADFQFAAAPTFVNDVVITRRGAYFTDSMQPVLYFVPLSRRGALPDPADVAEIELGGDFEFVPNAFNTNGIVATPNGKSLVIVNSTRGELYRVDPASGEASLIDLGGGSVLNGDGMLLDGKTLYVVQNSNNQIAVVRLKRNLSAGEIVDTLTDPDFAVPTTIVKFREALYAVNARFGTPVTPDTEYWVARVSIRDKESDSDD
jgi:sugar lactone lactonase YvrE